MHLSRLILNPNSRQALSEMGNPYEMHRTLMRAFPDAENGGPGRVLFHVDADPRTDMSTVLVQSEEEPDWSFLGGKSYLADVPDNPACKRYDPKVRRGQRLRFLLRANPTVKKVFDKDKPGKRIGLVREEDQIEWLKRKAESGGFRADAFRILPKGKQISRWEGAASTHIGVEFAGVLTVLDPDKFAETLASGIGSAKGFGFGLLSIAPV